MPAQNASPAPVMTMTLTRARSISSSTFTISACRVGLMQLRFSGRLKVM
jgi:hypothetical protein